MTVLHGRRIELTGDPVSAGSDASLVVGVMPGAFEVPAPIE